MTHLTHAFPQEDDEPESAQAVSERLQEEGCKLAEAGRYKQALAKWDQALLLTPDCAVLFELKAQVYLLPDLSRIG